MPRFFLILLLLASNIIHAQKQEAFFDIYFKPTENAGRYYVITEKKGEHWYREAFYVPENTQAMSGWYKDADCKIADSIETWYHSNRKLRSTTSYANGKKQGLYLRYHDNGIMADSNFYAANRLKGVSLGWDKEGYQIDSSYFDGAGNGTEVHWFPGNGPVSSSGKWASDTIRVGRWNYYHPNGKLLATEDYQQGEVSNCNCYTEQGQALDTAECKGQEAQYPGGEKSWMKFVQKNLNPEVPIKKGAPIGQYMVMVQFVVNGEGLIDDITALTKYGYGMEEEVVRMLKKAARWNPARQFGRTVKAYRKQPITFVIAKN